MTASTGVAEPNPPTPPSANSLPIRLFVGGVWLTLTAAMLGYVFYYGSNVPFFDDWRIVPYFTGDKPVTFEWLWSQHGDHRVPLSRLLLLALGKLCGYDFRCGMVFDVSALSATSLVLIAASVRLRGRLALADAFFPLVLINPGQWETYLWCWIISFTLPIGLALVVLAILSRWGMRPPVGAVLGSGLIVLALPLTDPAGLAFVPALVLWLATVGLAAWRSSPPSWSARILPFGFAASAFALLIVYHIGFKRAAEGGDVNPNAVAEVRTMIEVLSMGVGQASVVIYPVTAFIVLGMLVSTVFVVGRIWREQPQDRSRVVALVFFLMGSLCLAVALGGGRAGEGDSAGFKSRYVVLMMPIPCAVFLLWGCYRGRWRDFAQAGMCGVMLLLLPLNIKTAIDSGESFRPGMAAFEQDLHDGKPPSYLAERHTTYVHALPLDAPDRQLVHEGLLMLQRAGIGPYRDMAADVPFHEVPLALDPDGVRGSQARFFLPEPADVLAIRFTFAEGQKAGDLAVYVRRPGDKEVRRAEVAAVQPNFLQPDDQQPLLAYVNGPIDQVRTSSPDGRAYTLTEVVLLVVDR
jgi:hypothetical protein